MGVAHIVRRGAVELVPFWGERPLVREPHVSLFGVEELDPPELEFLKRSPMRRYLAADVQRLGAAVAAQQALGHPHAGAHEFLLHFDADTIAPDEFSAADVPRSGGVRISDPRAALS